MNYSPSEQFKNPVQFLGRSLQKGKIIRRPRSFQETWFKKKICENKVVRARSVRKTLFYAPSEIKLHFTHREKLSYVIDSDTHANDMADRCPTDTSDSEQHWPVVIGKISRRWVARVSRRLDRSDEINCTLGWQAVLGCYCSSRRSKISFCRPTPKTMDFQT